MTKLLRSKKFEGSSKNRPKYEQSPTDYALRGFPENHWQRRDSSHYEEFVDFAITMITRAFVLKQGVLVTAEAHTTPKSSFVGIRIAKTKSCAKFNSGLACYAVEEKLPGLHGLRQCPTCHQPCGRTFNLTRMYNTPASTSCGKVTRPTTSLLF